MKIVLCCSLLFYAADTKLAFGAVERGVAESELSEPGLMLIPCIARLYTTTNAVHWVISFILMSRLLHVLAHACHPQGAFNVLVSYMKTAM